MGDLDITRSQTNALNTEYYTRVFKAISHEGRLAILLELHKRDLSVSQLEQATRQRQTVVSQQLARLRKDDLVDFERAGKAVIYRISDPRLREMMDLLQGLAERGDAE